MNKCVSCGSELPPQTRFCGTCGAMQPDTNSLETISSTPNAGNVSANTPPPPPQPNTGDTPNSGGQWASPPGMAEMTPNANGSAGQSMNPPSGPSPQPQTFYGEYQQAYGNYPSVPQAQQPYGNYQPTLDAQQPYSYPPSPPPQPSYPNYTPTQPYGDYQQVPPSYPNYTPLPQTPMINTADTVANASPSMAGMTPTPTRGQPTPPAWRKWVIIALVAVVILAGAGLAYILLIPKLTPTLTVTSDYRDNGKYAGTQGTTLHIQGNQFAATSPITLLLDGAVYKPQDMQPQSDASGNFKFDLEVPASWSTGLHTLTAKDGSNNTTKTGAEISIVKQGYAGTPGPDGSPSNTANFKIAITLHMDNTDYDAYLDHIKELDAKGQSDAQGGSVCATADGAPADAVQLPGGINEQLTYTCSSTSSYNEGRITYEETLQTDNLSDSAGLCQLNSPQTVYIRMTGTYQNGEFSGDTITLNIPKIDQSTYTCTGDLADSTFRATTVNGTWTGAVTMS